ncbi:MAG: YsnF/AvaK domain-containing protein [Caldilineaceae bacterium]
MSNQSPNVIFDSSGERGTVENGRTITGAQGEQQLVVRFAGYPPLLIPVDALQLRKDGAYEIPWRVAELAEKGHTSTEVEETVIPVLQEEVLVDKRKVETAKVQIKTTVAERQETVDLPLLHEEVEVRRVPINRPVEGPLTMRQEGETLIIPLLEEVLVVQKQLLLKEEVHISKKRTEQHHPEQVTLRSEQVAVERVEQAVNQRR